MEPPAITWRTVTGSRGFCSSSARSSTTAAIDRFPYGRGASRRNADKFAISGFPRSRHTASARSKPLGYLTITHPFHPLTGQSLPVLFERHKTTGHFYVCEGGPLGTITLPEDATDRGLPPAERPLTYETLADLADVIAALKGR